MGLWEGVSDWSDLWVRWWHGELVGSQILWGHPVFVWGRVGKMMQFAGALTIIVEIIGPDRLDRHGRVLKRCRWSALVGQNITDALWPDDVGEPPREPTSADRLFGTLYHLAYWVLGGILLLVAYVLTQNIFVVLGLLIGLLLLLSLKRREGVPAFIWLPAFGLTVAMAAIIGISGFILNKWVVQPLAVGLRSKNVVRVSQIVGVALLVVGFQFDLLAARRHGQVGWHLATPRAPGVTRK